jgi:glycosyltransferase involved in cell wall biosynthesis
VEGEKIEVIYQAVNPLYEKRVSEEEKKQVRHRYHLPMSFMLTVGAVERRKNQLLILKAIEKGRIDMPLVIVGRHTDYIEELKQYISSERMENQVMFLTSLSDQELAVVYQMSELFLFPSLFEGWGAPIIEAITSGVPVITSTGSCFHETAGDAAIYVHPDNVEEMESSIQKVLGDSSVRKEMIERGMRYVRQFTEESVANKLMKVYKSLR